MKMSQVVEPKKITTWSLVIAFSFLQIMPAGWAAERPAEELQARGVSASVDASANLAAPNSAPAPQRVVGFVDSTAFQLNGSPLSPATSEPATPVSVTAEEEHGYGYGPIPTDHDGDGLPDGSTLPAEEELDGITTVVKSTVTTTPPQDSAFITDPATGQELSVAIDSHSIATVRWGDQEYKGFFDAKTNSVNLVTNDGSLWTLQFGTKNDGSMYLQSFQTQSWSKYGSSSETYTFNEQGQLVRKDWLTENGGYYWPIYFTQESNIKEGGCYPGYYSYRSGGTIDYVTINGKTLVSHEKSWSENNWPIWYDHYDYKTVLLESTVSEDVKYYPIGGRTESESWYSYDSQGNLLAKSWNSTDSFGGSTFGQEQYVHINGRDLVSIRRVWQYGDQWLLGVEGRTDKVSSVDFDLIARPYSRYASYHSETYYNYDSQGNVIAEVNAWEGYDYAGERHAGASYSVYNTKIGTWETASAEGLDIWQIRSVNDWELIEAAAQRKTVYVGGGINRWNYAHRVEFTRNADGAMTAKAVYDNAGNISIVVGYADVLSGEADDINFQNGQQVNGHTAYYQEYGYSDANGNWVNDGYRLIFYDSNWNATAVDFPTQDTVTLNGISFKIKIDKNGTISLGGALPPTMQKLVDRVNDPDFNFDFNGDGKLDVSDYSLFKLFDGVEDAPDLTSYLTAEAKAKLDLTEDGAITPDDVFALGKLIEILDRVNDPDFNFDFNGDGKLTVGEDYSHGFKWLVGYNAHWLAYLTTEAKSKLDLNKDGAWDMKDVLLSYNLIAMVGRVNDPDFNFDFNADGKLDEQDYRLFKVFDGAPGDLPDMAVFLTNEAKQKLDINKDGVVDSNDVVRFGDLIRKQIPPAVREYANQLQEAFNAAFGVGVYTVSVTRSPKKAFPPRYLVTVLYTPKDFRQGELRNLVIKVLEDGEDVTVMGIESAKFDGIEEVNAQLLYDGMGALLKQEVKPLPVLGKPTPKPFASPSKPENPVSATNLIAYSAFLVAMGQIKVTKVDEQGAIHFTKDGADYVCYRNTEGNLVLLPAPVHAYAEQLQSSLGSLYTVSVSVLRPKCVDLARCVGGIPQYRISINFSDQVNTIPQQGALVAMSFVINAQGDYAGGLTGVEYMGFEGKVDAELLFAGLSQLSDKPIDLFRRIRISQADATSGIYFSLLRKPPTSYRIYRNAEGQVVLERASKIPQEVQAYVDGLRKTLGDLYVVSAVLVNGDYQIQVVFNSQVNTPVKVGQLKEMRFLLRELNVCMNPGGCPSGNFVLVPDSIQVTYSGFEIDSQLFFEAAKLLVQPRLCAEGALCDQNVDQEALMLMTKIVVTNVLYPEGWLYGYPSVTYEFSYEGISYQLYRGEDDEVVLKKNTDKLTTLPNIPGLPQDSHLAWFIFDVADHFGISVDDIVSIQKYEAAPVCMGPGCASWSLRVEMIVIVNGVEVPLSGTVSGPAWDIPYKIPVKIPSLQPASENIEEDTTGSRSQSSESLVLPALEFQNLASYSALLGGSRSQSFGRFVAVTSMTSVSGASSSLMQSAEAQKSSSVFGFEQGSLLFGNILKELTR